ncbi:hypothetical protein C8Q72DRAFT_861767 [Fomitopsis betulina]|nr:hypothetical protein C8Q72DRAFT_861767 [Fomitopsis betulina]
MLARAARIPDAPNSGTQSVATRATVRRTVTGRRPDLTRPDFARVSGIQAFELEAQLATRTNAGGRMSGGGGFGPIRNRINTNERVRRPARIQNVFIRNSNPSHRINTNERVRRPARIQNVFLSEVPPTIEEVDAALHRAQVNDAVGLAAVRQLQQWRRVIQSTMAAGRPLSETQHALQNHWVGLPDWYRQQFPRRDRPPTNAPAQAPREDPPRYDDPPEKWASYFSRYPQARLPRGLVRDEQGQVSLERARLHMLMVGIASPLTSTRKRYKPVIFDALAALFSEPHVYVAHLQAAQVVPAPEVNITPLPETQVVGGHVATIDVTTHAIATHAAHCGITPELVTQHLSHWARDYLATGPRTAELDLTVNGAPPTAGTPQGEQVTHEGQPATGHGEQSIPNVAADAEDMVVEPLGQDSA